MSFSNRFSGQNAVVTGGADGIGRAVTLRLLEEGARVTVFDVNAANMEAFVAEMQGKGHAIQGRLVNVADEDQVKEGVEAAVAFSPDAKLDIMVHCAGIVGPTATRIVDVDSSAFDQVYAVNLRGTFLITKYALIAMEPKNYGRILNFASIAGKEGNAGMVSYSATKAGVIGLVKSVGKEYAETGITVNAVAPAVILTPLVEGVHPDQVKYMTDKIPMKRCGTLDEIAALTAWIVSPEASFCTAFTFDLSGGRAVY